MIHCGGICEETIQIMVCKRAPVKEGGLERQDMLRGQPIKREDEERMDEGKSSHP